MGASVLHELKYYEIRGKILERFEDYLITRFEKVKYNLLIMGFTRRIHIQPHIDRGLQLKKFG